MDSDAAPGELIDIGDPITWTYVITNSGTNELTNVVVTDSDGSLTVNYVSGDLDSDSELDTNEIWTYEATGVAGSGQYMNRGTVAADDILGDPLTDSDDSHYFGADPQVTIEKSTNGVDADTPTGPVIAVGDPVTWTYVIANPGTVTLTNIIVTDSDAAVTPVYQSGDTDTDNELDTNETWTYEATGTASAGQYMNTGIVFADDHDSNQIQDSDDSHYYGADPGIVIEKSTNGQDSDSAPGELIDVGADITWTYTVTNSGTVDLTNVAVTDSDPSVSPVYQSGDTDGDNELDLNETWTYEATGFAQPGQYMNTGTVSALDNFSAPVGDTDDSHYYGADPQIDIEKSTNGIDADTPTGPVIAVGDPVTWTYVVTNPGTVVLTNVAVSDSDAAVTPVYQSGDTDTDNELDTNETWTYEATGTAQPAQYSNTGTVTADDHNSNQIQDTDDSHYYGADPGISIEKYTNGMDSDNPPGELIDVGDPITWTYIVTNTGTVALEDLAIVDSDGSLTINYISGDTDGDSELDLSETWTYEATGTATAGQYMNTGTISADDNFGNPIADTDDSHYFGALVDLSIEKTTNGQDSDSAPGQRISVGSSVTWDYTVVNNGTVALTSVVVSDSDGSVTPVFLSGDNSPANGELDPGETWLYRATSTATAGQYMNTGTVTALDHNSSNVQDSDDSHYYGSDPDITVVKSTNGVDSTSAPGVYISVGDPVTWTYTVTNTGNVELLNVAVTDDQEGAASYVSGDTDVDNELDTNETWIYEITGTAAIGQYSNTATVDANDSLATPVSDTEDDYYFGSDPSVNITKETNGVDSGAAPGIILSAGDAITWTYTVINTGNVDLSNVAVVDDVEGSATLISGDTNTDNILQTTEIWTYQITGIATAGQYSNTGTVTADDPTLTTVSDNDDDYYFANSPQIDIEKATNGFDSDTAPGQVLAVGSGVTWTYTVTNPGNVELDNVNVVDSDGSLVVIYVGGDTDSDTLLDTNETWTYQATGTALPGQYMNTGTVTANDSLATVVNDSDDSHYIGSQPAISITKTTNGTDSSAAPGIILDVGDAVTWTYTVSNTGNVALSNVSVLDDIEGAANYIGGDTDTDNELDVSEVWTYQIIGTVGSGQYTNIGSVTAQDPLAVGVSDNDDDYYFGIDPGISIEKSTNGLDSDSAPGETITVGEPITWTYTVVNTGDAALSSVSVADDKEGAPTLISGDTNSNNILDVGETWTYEQTGVAKAGQYENTGSVTATTPSGSTVQDNDLSHYFGEKDDEPTGCNGDDFDGDGVLNDDDLDDDGDGILDGTEGTQDPDGDGLPNSQDIDADGDGIRDMYEAQMHDDFRPETGLDSDGDGLDDEYDPDSGGTPIVPVDTDGDGTPDYLDLDSDNDGIADNIEDQDPLDYVPPSGEDTDCDGLDDAYDPDDGGKPLGGDRDSDGTDVPDYREIPLECTDLNLIPTQFEIDGIGEDLFTQAQKAIRTRRRLASRGKCAPFSKSKAKKKEAKASEHYLKIWQNTWSFPGKHYPCQNELPKSCTEYDTNEAMTDNAKLARKMNKLVKGVLKSCQQVKNVKRIKKATRNLKKDMNEAVTGIPDPVLVCED